MLLGYGIHYLQVGFNLQKNDVVRETRTLKMIMNTYCKEYKYLETVRIRQFQHSINTKNNYTRVGGGVGCTHSLHPNRPGIV